MIFTPFTLEIDEEWANFVTFYVAFSISEERESKRLIKNLRADINAQLQAMSPEERAGKGKPVPAASANVDPILAFFRAHQFWQPGEYTARLVATCAPTSASVTRQFRFTLFESDVQELEGRAENYKYGYGVYLTDKDEAPVNPRILGLV